MSFFDEADEPRTEPRTVPGPRRPSGNGGGRRPPGGPRRPPGPQQAILVRRLIGVGAIAILLILIVLGVHSCDISSRNSSLKDYNNNVASLIQQSDKTSRSLFMVLSAPGGTGNVTSVQNSINDARVNADSQLSQAKGINVPGEVAGAQGNLVLTLQMRRDAIAGIANAIQPALSGSASQDAIGSIASQMARFYASDVLYKDYTTTLIAGALHAAGIGVGGTNGVSIESGQFLPDLQWLTPAFIATTLHGSSPTPNGAKAATGTHGHTLDSVSAGGTTLQTGSTNTVPASPPPVFTLHFTNGGQNPETNIVLDVSVKGTSITGKATVPQTMPGQSATAQVTLSASPPAGTDTVTATVEAVPGEKDTSNNSMSFPITFQ